jgi:hypothetical protein
MTFTRQAQYEKIRKTNNIIIPHILITINRLIWLDNGQKSEHVITQDKDHIPWNKNHIPPPRKTRGFSRQIPPELSFFDRKTSETLRTHQLQATVTIATAIVDVGFEYLRQRSNGLKICLPAELYMYVFPWFHSVK